MSQKKIEDQRRLSSRNCYSHGTPWIKSFSTMRETRSVVKKLTLWKNWFEKSACISDMTSYITNSINQSKYLKNLVLQFTVHKEIHFLQWAQSKLQC